MKSKSRDIILIIMGEYLSKPDKTKHTESGESSQVSDKYRDFKRPL